MVVLEMATEPEGVGAAKGSGAFTGFVGLGLGLVDQSTFTST